MGRLRREWRKGPRFVPKTCLIVINDRRLLLQIVIVCRGRIPVVPCPASVDDRRRDDDAPRAATDQHGPQARDDVPRRRRAARQVRGAAAPDLERPRDHLGGSDDALQRSGDDAGGRRQRHPVQRASVGTVRGLGERECVGQR